MRKLLLALLSLLIASSASAVSMDWTPIGNPGNFCDPQSQGCFGAVGYSYNIGTYEVTNAQYVEFLNAKAASDPFGLYSPGMGALPIGGIARSGSPGSYSYSAIGFGGERPVNYVSFYDAVRFANWMNNGQGSGDTETGAYILLGGTATPSNGDTVTRSAAATIVLPSANEWYKAAYYGPASSSYFDYPAGSNAPTLCTLPGTWPNAGNCDSGGFNDDLYDYDADHPTWVGSYSNSLSPYGTYDQGGNVREWNETLLPGSGGSALRGEHGGSYADIAPALAGYYFGAGDNPTVEHALRGFRVAMIPEPGTGLLVLAGLARPRRLAQRSPSHG